MNRRHYLAAIGGVVGVAGGAAMFVTSEVDSPQGEPVDNESVPDNVAASQPLAEAFHAEIYDDFDGVRVYVRPDGEMAVTYSTTATSGTGIREEFRVIANTYVDVVRHGDYDAVTLTIAAGGLQATVPRPTVTARADGTITQDAFNETIEVQSTDA